MCKICSVLKFISPIYDLTSTVSDFIFPLWYPWDLFYLWHVHLYFIKHSRIHCNVKIFKNIYVNSKKIKLITILNESLCWLWCRYPYCLQKSLGTEPWLSFIAIYLFILMPGCSKDIINSPSTVDCVIALSVLNTQHSVLHMVYAQLNLIDEDY